MLPSSKKYLIEGDYSPQAAASILIGCFLAGVVGIQILSRVLHHYIPSHVVDCDHTHEGQKESDDNSDSEEECHNDNDNTHSAEETPLLSKDHNSHKHSMHNRPRSATIETTQRPQAPFLVAPLSRRPSLQTRFTARVSTFVTGAKGLCDEGGPCYGYSDPCGQECFKVISRTPTHQFTRHLSSGPSPHHETRRTPAHPLSQTIETASGGSEEDSIGSLPDMHSHTNSNGFARKESRGRQGSFRSSLYHPAQRSISASKGDLENARRACALPQSSHGNPPNEPSQAHHHHVPSNAFLSIGLQTSIAIALHKLPEGFITFATNHANPKLGFAVFMALFIHNITEGFAMALPLYLALGSRWKAMLWSSFLGGISQPLGAGVAALCFKVAGHTDMAPGERIYGGMFAVTAGIMASVALQLFSESLALTHNRNLCTAFAFIGMGILGVSFALTAD